MIVQIYTFCEIEEALEAVEVGVDQIGFIVGRYGQVHGELGFDQARRLAAALPSHVSSVALTMATEIDEIVRMVNVVNPDILHISTDPLDLDVEAMGTLRDHLAGQVKVMKAIPVAGEESIRMARTFSPVSDCLLLDTKIPGLPGVGATGRTHDWKVSRRIVESVEIPVILAGGLTPENVKQAIDIVQPAGVDSNTGTNLANSPVEKDMNKIKRFAEAVRNACA
ncbi:MAG: phosphoribosylanthranilate isomerase [Chloroflexota bacterium]|nr:phosphoribosylanthranilate isomerase [Chloroflexota bacterium]